MRSVEFRFADGAAFEAMLATAQTGLPMPSGDGAVLAAIGDIVLVCFRIQSVHLTARGRVTVVRGERRIVLETLDLERLRRMVEPRVTMSFVTASGDSTGGATEVMSRDDLPAPEGTLPMELAPTSPQSFEPPLSGLVRRPFPKTTPGRRDLVGRILGGKYLVGEPIGSGAMGTVFRGRQLSLETVVAIKVMHGELDSTAMFEERFFREAQAAALLDHRGAVRVIDYGKESDGLAYIVTEFVDGRDLASVMEQEGPLETERIVSIALQILAALGKAHEVGLVHRDVKPANVLLVPAVTDDQERAELVKLCDFGLAKLLEPPDGTPTLSATLTRRGHLLGTPEYMSPEQAQGDRIDGRSDIYSVGVMLFHLATGELPFRGESAVDVLVEHVKTAPDPPSRRRAGVDPRFDAICLKAMAKRPEDRFEDARAMRRALRIAFAPPKAMLDASSYAVLPPPAPIAPRASASADRQGAAPHQQLVTTRRRRTWCLPAVAAFAVALALTVLWLLGTRHVR